MKSKKIISMLFFILVVQSAVSQSPSFKTFMNPVIPGDHPDCTLSKIGNYFYTAGSSFNPTPVIYRSTDLVHWEAVAQPVRADWQNYGDAPAGGCWGGQVVFKNNKYWYFFSRANQMHFTTADDIQGPWSMPTLMNTPSRVPGLGYDNSIFIDDDGRWYLLVKNGKENNWIVELGEDGQPAGAILDLRWINPAPSYPYSWAEGPVMWKYRGYYYYSFARDLGGGQKVFRSRTLTDDQFAWENLGDLFNLNDPLASQALFQNPNHCSQVVTLDDSTHWLVHPLLRTGNNNEWYGQGRQGLLNQVWYDANGKPIADYPTNVPKTAPALPSSGIPWAVPHSDFFNSNKLHPEWSFLGYTPSNTYSLSAKPGWLMLTHKNKPNTIIKKDGEHNYSLITKMEYAPQSSADSAGLWIFNGRQTLFVKLCATVDASGKIVVLSFKETSYKVQNPSTDNTVYLKLVRVNHQLTGYFGLDGFDWVQVGSPIDVSELDGWQEEWNSFTGNRQGLFVSGTTPAYFDYYIYRDAYTPILAECPANQYGTSVTGLSGGIRSLDNIHNNDWALYAGVEFGNEEYPRSADSVSFVASCASAGGTIEVWLDSIDTGTKIAECAITSTGSLTTFKTFSAPLLQPVSGNHDVYLKFVGNSSDKLFILQWMTFIDVPTGFRSKATGNWNDVNTWERYDGSTWVHPAPYIPRYADGVITIQTGHTVTITESDTIAQVFVANGATLKVASSASVVVKNAEGVDIRVDGVLVNEGELQQESDATIRINSGGKYNHARNGGTIPPIQWMQNSYCEITGVESLVPSNINGNYKNFVWNCASQNADISLKFKNNTIDGNFVVHATGDKMLTIFESTDNQNKQITLTGDYIQTGGSVAVVSSPNESSDLRIIQTGSININGGTFNLCEGNLGLSNSVKWQLKGNLTVTEGLIKSGTNRPVHARFVFNKQGRQQLSLASSATIDALTFEVLTGCTLNVGSTQITGYGHCLIYNGAILEISHTDGVDGVFQNQGDNLFSPGVSYIFNGTQSQVTGSLLPDTVACIVINNSSGLSLSKNIVVKDTLKIISGSLKLNNNVLKYAPEASLKYSGLLMQTTSDAEFPATDGPKNLVIDNRFGIKLHANREIRGRIDFQNGSLRVGEYTISASSVVNAAINKFVQTSDGGKLKLFGTGGTQTFFPVGTTRYAPVWITNHGFSASFSVGALSQTTPTPYGGRVTVKWTIEREQEGDGPYTLQFGWASELENSEFKNNRAAYARIFLLPDSLEVGTGNYTTQFTTVPYTVSRSGINTLGTFVVGMFQPPTSVNFDQQSVPTSFTLRSNYPNPFNPSTIIPFEVPSATKVTLKVYDLLGREVAALVDGVVEPGYHTVTFDAQDLHSGIYIVVLRGSTNSNDITVTKKIVLMK